MVTSVCLACVQDLFAVKLGSSPRYSDNFDKNLL